MKLSISYSTSGHNAMLGIDEMLMIMLARLVNIHVVVHASNYIYFQLIFHAAMVSKKDHNMIPVEYIAQLYCAYFII